MKISLKAPMMPRWILTDDELIKKKKRVKLTSIKHVKHTGTNDPSCYGVIQAIYGPGNLDFVTVSYPYEHSDIGIAAAKYIFAVVEKNQSKAEDAKRFLMSKQTQEVLGTKAEESAKASKGAVAILIGLVALIAIFICSQFVSCRKDYEYDGGKKCIFCEKRTATQGNYCDPCYDAVHPD